MQLVALLQAAEYRNGALYARLADKDLLEPALQGRILLDVLVVLVECRRADAVQIAAGKRGLEHIAGIERAVRLARSDHSMDLIDEENDLALLLLELVEDCLQPFLELAAVLRAGDKAAHVKGKKPLPLESLGHLLVDDSLGKALDNRGLADTRLTDQDGVVLRPSLKDLHSAPDFLVAPDDRIERSFLCLRGHVDAEFREGSPLLLGVLIIHAVAVSHFVDRFPHSVLVKAVFLHDLPERVTIEHCREDEKLRRDVLILELYRELLAEPEEVLEL